MYAKSVALLAEGVGRNNITGIREPARTLVALLAEGVGRNHIPCVVDKPRIVSPSSRRAWVEMSVKPFIDLAPDVALLAEGVGRNLGILR